VHRVCCPLGVVHTSRKCRHMPHSTCAAKLTCHGLTHMPCAVRLTCLSGAQRRDHPAAPAAACAAAAATHRTARPARRHRRAGPAQATRPHSICKAAGAGRRRAMTPAARTGQGGCWQDTRTTCQNPARAADCCVGSGRCCAAASYCSSIAKQGEHAAAVAAAAAAAAVAAPAAARAAWHEHTTLQHAAGASRGDCWRYERAVAAAAAPG
jgi:hypothetical protein